MGSATSAVLDALAEEGAETEQALRAARWAWRRKDVCAVQSVSAGQSSWHGPHH